MLDWLNDWWFWLFNATAKYVREKITKTTTTNVANKLYIKWTNKHINRHTDKSVSQPASESVWWWTDELKAATQLHHVSISAIVQTYITLCVRNTPSKSVLPAFTWWPVAYLTTRPLLRYSLERRTWNFERISAYFSTIYFFCRVEILTTESSEVGNIIEWPS